ncbi:MAG TPA: hypothetical protein VHH34_11335, partial [Pseudonocardiaceae bacterium]|nr:hypothetical protein [Pseudonocardiaceae bacterium]
MTTETSPPPATRVASQARPPRGSAWAKHVLVFLHVLCSLGWWAMGLAQLSFMLVALDRTGEGRLVALEAAQHLDHTMLIYFANAAAYTGIMLAALTPWGFFRHWWVTVKFAATIVVTVVGIALLGQWRQQMIDATRSGGPGPSTLLVLGSVAATVAVLAFLTWVSIAMPWGTVRSRARRDRSPQRAPTRTFLLATAP